MNTRMDRRRSFALTVALALVPTFAAAQTAGPGGDVYARMQKVNAGLKSYQAVFHVDVRMRSFLPLNPSLDGIAYYKQPDKNAIVFNTVPILAQQFKKIYPQLEPPAEWPKLYDVTPVSDDGTTTQFRLVRKKNGRIDHVDVTVDDRTATVASMTYVYKDGGSVSFQQTYRAIDGNYVLATQTGKVDLPQYKADVASTFSNYKLNVAIDDQVFAPE
jgi:outer membrane lipoprotein-sorting protein